MEFGKDKTFETDLRQRVNQYFQQGDGQSKAGNWRLHLKAAIILTCFAISYVLLVFVAENIWQGLPLVVLLGLFTACIGFNIAHDAGHKAFSKTSWVNDVMAKTMDLVGGSSYMWYWKHVVIHHRYVNITGYDTDIDLGVLGRLSPHQTWHPYYRWQHFYLWFVYGFLAIQWEFVGDFQKMILGGVGKHRFPRPTTGDLVVLIAGKVVFFGWALLIPWIFHPWYVVLFYYAIGVLVLGGSISIIFQLPHCVSEADFPLPRPDTAQIEEPWAVHQVRVTLDYARRNPIVGWLFGGLNFHKEHHLFPTISHIHYPAISSIVEKACKDHGLQYKEHKTLLSGIAAHYRWLRKMGQPD
ncbi:fatty acid desaturase family protein [Desulfoferula mesophila]|uniref:Fatty acid desaturase n=1 Tax=Desulfoferula mesophila TaxID=3058419 RepID=A0AAU9ECD5_9BACT|nr:fatty acid desaturase [Desulfoferula mesophilus]